jgi:hypothetical protein
MWFKIFHVDNNQHKIVMEDVLQLDVIVVQHLHSKMWNCSNFNWNNMYFRNAVVPAFVSLVAVAHVARVAALVNSCDCYINPINKFDSHLTVQNISCG